MLSLFRKKISDNKKVVKGLTEVYGIGYRKSVIICKTLGISLNTMVGNLAKSDANRLVKYIKNNLIVEDFLKKQRRTDIERYINNLSIKGFRHRNKLPVRGQRTHTNARTRKKGRA